MVQMPVSRFPSVVLTLPGWVDELCGDPRRPYPSLADRVRLVVDLARRNVAEGTGGPFGAAIFEIESGRLIAPGVNRVVPTANPVAHAELVAIGIAARVLDTFDLGSHGFPRMELVASTEPCAMCLGAVPWAGVRRLVCAARDEDARAVGFDEGVKPRSWVDELERRGIQVVRDVERDAAVTVLRDYLDGGGTIYNGRLGD